MKALMITACAVAFVFNAPAVAGELQDNAPLHLSDVQMDNVTAGVGANNVATQPWDALRFKAGHSLNHNLSSDASTQFDGVETGVAVPGAVRKSVCLAFC